MDPRQWLQTASSSRIYELESRMVSHHKQQTIQEKMALTKSWKSKYKQNDSITHDGFHDQKKFLFAAHIQHCLQTQEFWLHQACSHSLLGGFVFVLPIIEQNISERYNKSRGTFCLDSMVTSPEGMALM